METTEVRRIPSRYVRQVEARRDAARGQVGVRRDEWLPASVLGVDMRYQRAVNRSLIRKIEIDFNFDLFGAVTVSERADGTLWIVDGQHRVVAATEVFNDRDIQVPCRVLHGLTIQDEADFFSRQGVRKPVRSSYLFRAAVVAGDEDAVALNALLESYGLRINTAGGGKPFAVAAFGALRRMFRLDPEAVGEALGILVEVYGGDPLSLNSEALWVAWGFATRYAGRYSRRHLVTRLRDVPVGEWSRRVRALTVGRGPGSFDKYGAQVWVELYNLRLRDEAKRLPDWAPAPKYARPAMGEGGR